MGNRLNRVENFDVAGAPAEVCSEVRGPSTLESETSLSLRFGSALASRCPEYRSRIGVHRTLRMHQQIACARSLESFEGGDLAPLACVNRLLTCNHSLTVDDTVQQPHCPEVSIRLLAT